MTAPTIDKLRAYLPLKTLTADGQALTVFTATGASTASILYSATLNQADATWDGALGFFAGDTLTAGLRGLFFHVRVSTVGNVVPAENLPVVPQAGDTFSLALGGKYRSSQEAFGLLADDVLPELIEVAGGNITGLVVKKASPMLGVGTLKIHYDSVAQTLTAKMGTGAYGTAVDASGNLSDVSLFIDADAGFVRVDCTAASLPVGDADDTWVLTQPKETFTPDIEGYEGALGINGKLRYRLEVVRNEDSLTSMVDLSVYSDKPAGAATTIALGSSLGLTAADFTVDDATDWPLTGFWVRNTTKDDCRYIFERTGNVLSAAKTSDWVLCDVASANRLPASGNYLFTTFPSPDFDGYCYSYGSSKLIVRAATGTWAAGVNIYVINTGGWLTITNVHQGLRGLDAVAWAAGDAIELMGDVDLMIDHPVFPAYTFSGPATEITKPYGGDFAYAGSAGEAIAIGTIVPGELVGVWRREWIMDDHRTRIGISTDTMYSWS